MQSPEAPIAARASFDWRALLRDFPNRPGAWRTLATHLVPVVGVIAFGWSTAYLVLAYWLDLALTAAAIVAVLSVHAIDETAPHLRGLRRIGGIVALFLFVTPIVGLPALIPGWLALGSMPNLMGELSMSLRGDVVGMAGFGVMIALHVATVVRQLQRGDRRQVRDELREGFSLMIFKAIAFWLIASHFGIVLALLGRPGQVATVCVLAAILTAADVYRAEILKAMNVDRGFHDDCERPAGTPSRRGRGRGKSVLGGIAEAERRARDR